MARRTWDVAEEAAFSLLLALILPLRRSLPPRIRQCFRCSSILVRYLFFLSSFLPPLSLPRPQHVAQVNMF